MNYKHLTLLFFVILFYLIANFFVFNFITIRVQNKTADFFMLDVMTTALVRRDIMINHFEWFHNYNPRYLQFVYQMDLIMLESYRQLNLSKARIFKSKDISIALEASFINLEQFFPCCNKDYIFVRSLAPSYLRRKYDIKYLEIEAFYILCSAYKEKIKCFFEMVEKEDNILMLKEYCNIKF